MKKIIIEMYNKCEDKTKIVEMDTNVILIKALDYKSKLCIKNGNYEMNVINYK